MAISHDKDQVTSLAQTFTPTEGATHGAGAGTVVGILLGVTFWTHAPAIVGLLPVAGIVAFCAAAGSAIGIVVSKMTSEQTH